MGSPWRAPLSNLKHFVLISPFMMPDSWLFNENFYPFNELFNEPYLFKAKVKN